MTSPNAKKQSEVIVNVQSTNVFSKVEHPPTQLIDFTIVIYEVNYFQCFDECKMLLVFTIQYQKLFVISYLMEGGKIKIGYWKIRGRGQVIRHLLAYTGLEHEQKTYVQPNEWFAVGDKAKLGLDFPNLPYLIRGDFKITESLAIANYIIRASKHPQLLGKNIEDQAKVEMLMFMLQDIFNPTLNMFFSPNYNTDKTRLYDNKVKTKLEELNHFIGDKDFVLGYLTLVDFKIAEMSYYFEKLYTEHTKNFETLFRIRKNVENLAQIKEFYQKGGIAAPFLPSYAQLKF